MEATVRRSRMHRASTGRRIELSPRDIAIFCVLAQYRYLPSTYIHAFVGGASTTRFKERLGDLFHEGYLDRPEQQWTLANCRYVPVTYELGNGAKRALADHGTSSNDARTWLTNEAHRQFAHSLLVCELVASFELGTLHASDLRFIPWAEILAKAPEATRRSAVPFRIPVPGPSAGLVPDAIFGLEYRAGGKRTYRFVALEADRGTMPVVRSNPAQSSYGKKIAAYQETLTRGAHRSHLGLPNLLVLTVTTNEPHLRQIIKYVEQSACSDAAFLFGALAAPAEAVRRPLTDLLTMPWRRVGWPPLRLDQG